MRCDVKSGVGKEDRHTTRHHWSGISATEEEQADVQAGSQKRHDDRSQTSILSHRLETGHQQQRGGGSYGKDHLLTATTKAAVLCGMPCRLRGALYAQTRPRFTMMCRMLPHPVTAESN